jgi:uracil-DNA glycosylase family 4
MNSAQVVINRQRRLILGRAIGDCHRCERREVMSTTPRAGVGPSPSPYMMLTDTPNSIALSPNFPHQLKAYGLPLLREWYITSTVKCSTAPPSPDEQHRCLDHLRHELKIVNPELILLLGVPALHAVGVSPKTKLSHIHGLPFKMPLGPFKDRVCYPTFHPGVAYKSDHFANLLTEDLSNLYGLLSGRVNLSDALGRVGAGGTVQRTVEVA